MVPDGWKLSTLAKLITSLSAGVSVNSTDRHPNDTEYAVLKTSCVSGDKFDPTQRKAVVLTEEIDRLKEPLKGDSIIISRMNTPSLVGANAYIPYPLDKTYLPDRLWQVNVKNEMVNMRWLSIWFSSSHTRFLLSNLATGTSGSMKNITKGDVLALKILIPPLTEQIKIAEILSTYDKTIITTEKLLANSEQQKKALMQQLLTGKKRFPGFAELWKEITIGNVAKLTAGGTPSTRNSEYWKGDIPWMNSGEINLKKVFSVEGRISQSGLENSSTKIISKNCVLIALAGQGKTRGKVAINKIELCINQSIAAIIPDKNLVDYEFLYFNLDFRYKELRSLSTGDGGRGGLNLNILRSVKLSLPALNEQKKISNILSICEKELDFLTNQINQLKKEKKSLIQQLLTGKRRITNLGISDQL